MADTRETKFIAGWDLIGKMNDMGRVDCICWGGIKGLSVEELQHNLMATRGSSTFVLKDGEVRAPIWGLKIG